MLRIVRLATVVLPALALTACASTMTVSSHVQSGLDFTPYRTWDWEPAGELPTGDARLDANPFFKDHVQGAVEKGLAARGLATPTSGTPDLLIHYHASTAQRVNLSGADTSRGYSYDDPTTSLQQYEAGTLVIDIVDTKTKRVIWRGWAQETVEDSLDNQDRMAKQIDEAVTRMLARLPPQK